MFFRQLLVHVVSTERDATVDLVEVGRLVSGSWFLIFPLFLLDTTSSGLTSSHEIRSHVLFVDFSWSTAKASFLP